MRRKKRRNERTEKILIRSRSLQFILSPLTISLKNPSLLNFFRFVFVFLSFFLIFYYLFYAFRGKEEFLKRVSEKEGRRERERERRKNYDSHYFKFDWYSQPFAMEKAKKKNEITNFWGFEREAPEGKKNIGLTWLKYEIIFPDILPCFFSFFFVSLPHSQLCVIIHLLPVNKNVLQYSCRLRQFLLPPFINIIPWRWWCCGP